jgi:DNA-binding Xre family transcriptional regulator
MSKSTPTHVVSALPDSGGVQIVSHLRELLVVHNLSVRQLATRIALPDPRRLYELRNNEAITYEFDILARLCAIFGFLPLQALLEYVPAGGQPTPRFQQYDLLAELPATYGGICCHLLEHRGTLVPTRYFQHLAEQTRLHWTTLAKLSRYESCEIRITTLRALASHFEGLESIFTYDPQFRLPAKQ